MKAEQPLAVSPAVRAPRYHQVYVALRGWIVDGTYGPGSRIPAEPALCRAFGVSRITIRRAIDELVAERLLVRRQGSGTFVVEGAGSVPAVLDLGTLMQRTGRYGRATGIIELRVGWVTADEETRAALELEPGAKVHRSSRVRVRQGERLGLVTAWVREDVGRRLRPAMLRKFTVLECVERAGGRIGSAEQAIGATLAGIDAARALDVPVGTPLVRVARVVRSADGRPVERVEALWRADAYEYRMHLKRVRRGSLSGWVPD